MINIATDRDQINKAAAAFGWRTSIDSHLTNEFRSDETKIVVHYCPDGNANEALYFRGDIGLSYLAPVSGITSTVLEWLGR